MDFDVDTRVAKADLDVVILNLIKGWAVANPADLIDFDKQMKRKRSALAHSDRGGSHVVGMMKEGKGLAFGEIPRTLHDHIANRTQNPHWIMDKVFTKVFWRLFRVGRFNQTSGVQNGW